MDLYRTSGGCRRVRPGAGGRSGPAAAAERAGAGKPGQVAAQGAVRSDRQLVHRQQPRHPGLAVRAGDDPEADARRPEAPRRLRCRRSKDGKVYRDDIGQCWPAGVPIIMTRVWPIAMIQMPTAIYMISEFMNSLRTVYPRRPHRTPIPTSSCARSTASRSAAGRATRWSSRRRTSSTTSTTGWIRASRPASELPHRSSAIRLINDGKQLEIAMTLTDPQELGRRVERGAALEPRERHRHAKKSSVCPT